MSTPKFSRFLLSLLVSFFLSSENSVAQSPTDNISVYSFNEKFLEHLIKEQIDSVRLAHQLQPLCNDSILYTAAKFHSNYLFKKGALSHTEPENPVMLNPQKRAEHFGAVNYLVGENVAFTYVNTPTKDKTGKVQTNSTYIQTAVDFAIMWEHSPGHYKNIITPDYNSTGVAIWADQKTGRIYAVQKFATILYKYTFDENKSFFSFSNYTASPVAHNFDGIEKHIHKGKHVHKLKTPSKESQCATCYTNTALQFGLSRIEEKNGKIIFTSYDFQQMLNLLKKRKDGFAVEIISYNPYDCGNPAYFTEASRRNGQCVFSGKVLKPVYKKKAIKGFRAGSKRKKIEAKMEKGKIKKYEISLGKLPKELPGFVELNLVIIQKKRVCRVMRFTGHCGDTLERFFNLPLFVDTLPIVPELKEDYKNVKFSIPFQKGKTEYNMSDIKPLTDSLLSGSFTADSIVIKAYSSVEGSESLNKKLQDERAGHITKALAANQKENLNTVIISEENWTLFEKQIKDKDALKEFRNLSHEKIKELLEDTARQRKYEPFLREQRVAHIRLRAKEILNEKNIEVYLTLKIKEKKSRILKLLPDESKKSQLNNPVDSLLLFMGNAYKYIQSKTIKPEFFKLFKVSDSKLLNEYNVTRLKYIANMDSAKVHQLEWGREFYGEAVSLYNNKKSSYFLNYNMLALIQLYGKEMNVSVQDNQQNSYLAELRYHARDSLQFVLADKLETNFWFKVCRQTKEEIPTAQQGLHANCLENIHAYFQSKKLSYAEKNKISYYYIYHSRPEWAIELQWPDYEQKMDNPEGLVILAKILYQNYQEHKDSSYYDFLKEIYLRMGEKKWCPMFVGPCNVSFQALDYENFRDFYCEKCKDYLNYAKAPQAGE